MGRRVRRYWIIIPAAAALAFVLLLATCSNAFDIFNAIKTDLKIANDLFLAVKSISPEENAQLVNPGVPIVIVFDRSMDPDSLNASNIVITPALSSVSYDDYNENTKTLSIEPIPYMDGPQTYEVRITKGVKGADGSALQDEIVWSFDTRQWPAGSLTIEGGANFLNHASSVTLTIDKNSTVTIVEIGNELQGDGSINVLFSGNVNTVPSYDLAAGEGVLTVYARFGDGANYSDIESDTIFRDTVDPTVYAGADRNILVTTSPAPPASVWHYASSSDPSPASGIAGYAWTFQSGPGSLSFGNAASEDTTILADTDNDTVPYVLRLTVTDKAGNTKYDEVSIKWDRTAPNPPSFTSGTTNSPATITNPTWEWQTGGSSDSKLYYRRSLDGGTNYYTYGTSYTPSSLGYGPHTLSVAERDNLGNWSTARERTIYVSPSGIVPLWGAYWVSRTTSLSWPSTFLYTSKVYFGKAGSRLSLIYTGSGSSTPVPYTLSYGTKYEWYYTRTTGKITTRYPSGTDYYSFTTLPEFPFP